VRGIKKKKGRDVRGKKKIVTREARWRWRKTVPEERERSHFGVPRTAIGRQEAPILRNKAHGCTDYIQRKPLIGVFVVTI
jgi:hypothetical protein